MLSEAEKAMKAKEKVIKEKEKAKEKAMKEKAKAIKEKAKEKAMKEKAKEKAMKEKAKEKAMKEKAKEKAMKAKAKEKAMKAKAKLMGGSNKIAGADDDPNKKDNISNLPSEIKRVIAEKLSPMSRSLLHKTSKTMKKEIPLETLQKYLRTNHPNFIHVFKKALFEYKTTQTEKEIFKEHEEDFNEYKNIIRYQEEGDIENDDYPYTYENDYDDENGVFPKVIGMYFKLLNVSNMNPKYIYDLARVYHYKQSALNYKEYGSDEDVLMSIDTIVQHELYKIYVLMYLLSSDKAPFVYENLSESFVNIMSILWGGIEFYEEYYIKPYIPEEETYECYSYIFDTIKPDKDKSVKNNFNIMKEEEPKNRFITIPSGIASMKALKKHPAGIKNYENCLQNILTNKASITNYTKEGEKLNLLSAFGL